MKEVSIQQAEPSPSLLRQIVDEADTLDETGKLEVLRKIKLQKALSLAQQADEIFKGKFKSISEKEIAELVSDNRRKHYEKKIRN